MLSMKQLKDRAEHFKQVFPELTLSESIKHAQVQYSQELYIRANNISSTDKYPPALESIAIELNDLSKKYDIG